MSASVGGFVVIPGLLFLLALVLLAPGPLRMFGGAVMMLVLMGLFFVQRGSSPEFRAVAPARIERAVPAPAPVRAPVQVPVPPPPPPPPVRPAVQVPVPVPAPEVVVPE